MKGTDLHSDTVGSAEDERKRAADLARRRKNHQSTRPQLLTRDALDGRTAAAKYFDELTNAIENDLGGHDALSAIERTLVQGYVGTFVTLQHLNVLLARGQPVDLDQHAQCCSALVRIASRLGLQRRPKDATPTLEQYLAEREEIADRDIVQRLDDLNAKP